MSGMDEPDPRPTIDVHIEYLEDVTERQAAAGEGISINVVASNVTTRVMLLSLLRACEAVASHAVREAREEQAPGSTAKLDEQAEVAITSINARLLAISLMSDMTVTPQAIGFSI